MADGQLGHVVLFLPQTDKVVIYPRLILPRVVEVEVLRLHIVLRQLLRLEFRDVFEEALLLRQRHTPYHHGPVFEEEHLGRVDLGVEI